VTKPRIGLVLGGGGPVGHAYHCGALRAIEESTGWDPRTADVVVGTSAGAQVAALLRAGMGAADLFARVTGGEMSADGAGIAHHYTRPEPARGGSGRGWRPASSQRLLRALRRPWEAHPGTIVAALAPEGRTALTPMADGMREVFGDAWPADATWFVALRLDTGQRVALGRAGAPHTDVGRAVTASCAVPGMFAPVEIEFSRYVDGGAVSPTNADLLEDEGLDLVLVLAPTSARTGAGVRPDTPVRHLMRAVLDSEVRKLAKAGIPAFVVQPGRAELDAMGVNALDSGRMEPVARAARESTVAVLSSPDEAGQLAALRTVAQSAQ